MSVPLPEHLNVLIRRRDYLLQVATNTKALQELAALTWAIEFIKDCGRDDS